MVEEEVVVEAAVVVEGDVKGTVKAKGGALRNY